MHCGTTLRLRSCSPNPASRPVRAGHTRKTARRGTASSSSTPPSIPTHCAEQVLYFNAQGLLKRMNYSVDVVGDMVAGATARYCFDHTPFGGLVIPTLRRAVSRTHKGAVLSGPTGVLLQMSDIKLIPNAPKEKNNDQSRTTVRC